MSGKLYKRLESMHSKSYSCFVYLATSFWVADDDGDDDDDADTDDGDVNATRANWYKLVSATNTFAPARL